MTFINSVTFHFHNFIAKHFSRNKIAIVLEYLLLKQNRDIKITSRTLFENFQPVNGYLNNMRQSQQG